MIKPFKKTVVIGFAGLALMGASTRLYGQKKQNIQQQKPNIIFILTDDQRWDALGFAGNKDIITPEMDKLAASGAYFANSFVTTPICSASRASILTGLYERTHRYTFQTGPVQEKFMATSYPRLLKEAGYFTGFFGKLGIRYPMKDQLFDVVDDYDRNNLYKDRRGYFYKTIGSDTVHLTRYTGQQAVDFIEQTPPDKPFCLSLSFSAPHAHDGAPEQYFWQPESSALYADNNLPGPELAEDKYFSALPQAVRNGFNRVRWKWRYDSEEKFQHSVKGYYRMITEIDREIGKIRLKLKERGLDKNTVIILMGDNGYFMGERQLAGKWLMYDNSLRVPLIVYDPRIRKNRQIDEMALNIDVPATIADLAGIQQPEAWHGKSLVPLLKGEVKSLERDTVLVEHLWEFENIPPSEGVRTTDWKYFRYVNNKSVEELYNLKNDPDETTNLAGNSDFEIVLNDLRNQCNHLISAYSASDFSAPTGLTVEFIREPQLTQIVDDKPEFGWELPTGAPYQKGYQVLVASDLKLLNNNIGDVWNSGRVFSAQSTNVEFAGKPLHPNTSYYWKVRIYDQDNRLSDYSQFQMFKTGKFGGNITTGNWFQIEKIKAKESKELKDGSYFYDFGKAAFGTLELHYKAQQEEMLTIHLGEKLLNGRIDRKPGGSIRYQMVQLKVVPGQTTYQLELVPDKRNTNQMAVALPDSFPVVLPFRYVEIENSNNGFSSGKAPEKDEVVQVAYFNYFDYTTSSFSSSDTILNQVWEMCKYSQKVTTFAGVYIDGDRERIPYEADAYLNQLSHYSVDKEYAIARKTIEYFMEKPTWPTEWQLHVALLFYQDYMYTGNTELIKKYYEALKHKTLMALEVEDGFISVDSEGHNGELMMNLGFADTTQRLRDIVDWPQKGGFGGVVGEDDGFVFTPVNTVVNSMYYGNMKIMAEFARLLNKPEDEMDFEFRAAKVRKAMNEQLYHEDKGYYADGLGTEHGSVHANMFPLAFGVVPEAWKKHVVNHIKSRGMACSVYGAQYLMEAVYNAGEEDYGLELMTATHDRSWFNMIKVGSTVSMEAWDMKYKPNSDWNHAWGAAPANIIPRYLWGVKPVTPGFGIVEIKPQLSTLNASSIRIPTIKGTIAAEYKMLNRNLKQFEIVVPSNMTANFIYDWLPRHTVTLNGETINVSQAPLQLSPGINMIEVRVDSF